MTASSDLLLDLVDIALDDVDARLPILDRVRFRHRLVELVHDGDITIERRSPHDPLEKGSTCRSQPKASATGHAAASPDRSRPASPAASAVNPST